MRFAISGVIALLVSALLLVGCGQHSNPPSASIAAAPGVPPDSELKPTSRQLAQSLRNLNLSNPIADLDARLLRGDRRFIGLNGYTCAAPGLDYSAGPNDEQHFVFSFGIDCIAGTSDVLDDQLFSLQSMASAYAATYNQRAAAPNSVRKCKLMLPHQSDA